MNNNNDKITLQEFFSNDVPPCFKADFICTVKNDYDGKMTDTYNKEMLHDILSSVMMEKAAFKGAF